MIDNNVDVPTCHYCGRLAFEFSFDEIAVCKNCIETMSVGHIWRLVRIDNGDCLVTCSDIYKDFEVIAEGTFKEMWQLSLDMD